VLEGVLRGAGCVANLTADFLGSDPVVQQVHEATSVISSINGMVGGFLGTAIGGSAQSMTLGADAATLLGDTVEQALSPKPGMLGNLQFAEYIVTVLGFFSASDDLSIEGDRTTEPLDISKSGKDFSFTGGDPSDIKELDEGTAIA
jgi:hypothetical protein